MGPFLEKWRIIPNKLINIPLSPVKASFYGVLHHFITDLARTVFAGQNNSPKLGNNLVIINFSLINYKSKLINKYLRM